MSGGFVRGGRSGRSFLSVMSASASFEGFPLLIPRAEVGVGGHGSSARSW